MSAPETTGRKRGGVPPVEHRFKPGNPGRPKGSKNKLQEDFLKDVLQAWEESGAQAIKDMIDDKPGEFVKMVAGLLPKEATLNINDNSELSDDELIDRIRSLTEGLAPFLVERPGSGEALAFMPEGSGKPH